MMYLVYRDALGIMSIQTESVITFFDGFAWIYDENNNVDHKIPISDVVEIHT